MGVAKSHLVARIKFLNKAGSRICLGWYAPVMAIEKGQRVVNPMRYQCRPAGQPVFYDAKYPGT